MERIAEVWDLLFSKNPNALELKNKSQKKTYFMIKIHKQFILKSILSILYFKQQGNFQ